jgi:hypothetical protein
VEYRIIYILALHANAVPKPIVVSDSTWKRLMQKKLDLGVKSLDAAVIWALNSAERRAIRDKAAQMRAELAEKKISEQQ